MVLLGRIELPTSPLPRDGITGCFPTTSTTYDDLFLARVIFVPKSLAAFLTRVIAKRYTSAKVVIH